MSFAELDAALFFDPVPGAYGIFRAFADAVLTLYPDAEVWVQKTQITFYNPGVFACASLLRARKKAELPNPWLTVTLGLPYRLESPRVAACVEPYPGRWTTHIVLGATEKIDDELLSWVRKSYEFAAQRKKKKRSL